MNVALVAAVCPSSAIDQCERSRFPVFLPVSFAEGVSAQTGTVVDISREGCRIRCADAAPGEEYVQVESGLDDRRERAEGQPARMGSLRFSP